VFETDIFRFIKAKPILSKLAETYPTPRKKENRREMSTYRP